MATFLVAFLCLCRIASEASQEEYASEGQKDLNNSCSCIWLSRYGLEHVRQILLDS